MILSASSCSEKMARIYSLLICLLPRSPEPTPTPRRLRRQQYHQQCHPPNFPFSRLALRLFKLEITSLCVSGSPRCFFSLLCLFTRVIQTDSHTHKLCQSPTSTNLSLCLHHLTGISIMSTCTLVRTRCNVLKGRFLEHCNFAHLSTACFVSARVTLGSIALSVCPSCVPSAPCPCPLHRQKQQ